MIVVMITAPSTRPRTRRSSRVWLSFAGVVLIAAAAAAAWLAARDRSEPIGPNGPEQVVRQYLLAVAEHQQENALALLTDDLQANCQPPLRLLPYDGEVTEMTVLEAQIDGTSATVEIDVKLRDGDLVHVGGQVDLTRTAGGWRISAPQWPMFGCSEKVAR